MIAAVAVGGSLAVASAASAIQVPIGSPGDQSSTTVYGLYDQASGGLLLAENLISATGIDTTHFSTAFSSASQLTSTNVPEIASDFAVTASSNPSNFYKLDTAWCETPTTEGGAGQSPAVCTSNGGLPPDAVTSQFTGTVQPEVATAATNWPDLSDLVSNLGSATGVLNSADSATVSSSATITSTTSPFEYDIKLSAPSGGYILPGTSSGAFSLTFPAGLSVNAALVSAEINAASNTAAVEANPSGTAIGTVTLSTPIASLADSLGATNGTFTGKIYVVQTGQSSGQGSITQPYLELWYAPGVYQLGSFPSSLSFPLTLSFPEAVTPLGPEPLPLNSLELNFPAATSPVKSSSCTSIPTVGATATDAIAGLAYEFGDTSDGVSSPTGTASAVTLAATPTAVTDKCVTVAKVKNTATGSMGGLKTGKPTLTLRIRTGTAFGTVTVGLPRGLSFVKSKRLAKEISASSGKVKAVRIAHGKLVIALRHRVKSTTVKTRRGAIAETAALIKSIKRHKTKKLRVSVRAGNASMTASIKA